MARSTDREALTGAGQRENYASEENLLKRQSLQSFTDPSLSSGGLPIDRLELTGVEHLLDVGTGNGRWLWRLAPKVAWCVGLDLSMGMLEAVRGHGRNVISLMQANAQALPFSDASFDLTCAMHMLYHVDDVLGAIKELHRVLRRSGRALVTTNSAEATPIGSLCQEAVVAVLGRPVEGVLPSLGFTAENGFDLLSLVFEEVTPAWHVVGQRITDPGPVLAMLDSVRGPMEMFLETSLDWARVGEEVTARLEGIVTEEGAFINRSRSASFLCRKG
ncbi:MAG: class I SAM-dependent methyltransferase [Acidimicrobiales bacterium]|nr:class I SAM-dependent methyltransferase [Acidimicrobiales bacterium]